MAEVLDEGAIKAALRDLPGWKREGEALVKTFKCKNFAAAVAFIVRVGFLCEKKNHHPDLSNTYNRVTLRFTTHDAGGKITDRDVALARAVEAVAAEPYTRIPK